MRNAALFALLTRSLASSVLADDVPPAGAEKAKPTEWMTEFDKAVEAAKAQKKDLLVDFTGSDWCGWCIKLHDEVFAKPEFQAEAPKSFVLVSLDFPRSEEAKAKVPNPARNKELSEKYEVQGFPTILVLSPDGDVLARSGYGPGGPKVWLESLATATDQGRKVLVQGDELEKEYGATPADKPESRSAVVEKAIGVLAAAPQGGPTAKVGSVVRHGLELDADGKSGLAKRSLSALFAAGRTRPEDAALGRRLDPKNDEGLLEHVALAQFSRLQKIVVSQESFEANKADVEDYVATARVVAAGALKNADVFVPALANACHMAKQLLHDDAAAREIAKALVEKGPKGNERLNKYLESFLAEAK